MKKKLLALCLTLALLCGAGALAAGESYSFPAAGVFVEPAEGWQLFSPETLDAAGETLTRLGADADVLRADWAAAGTVSPHSSAIDRNRASSLFFMLQEPLSYDLARRSSYSFRRKSRQKVPVFPFYFKNFLMSKPAFPGVHWPEMGEKADP